MLRKRLNVLALDFLLAFQDHHQHMHITTEPAKRLSLLAMSFSIDFNDSYSRIMQLKNKTALRSGYKFLDCGKNANLLKRKLLEIYKT
uniref:Uncharacterized protein n=1 Tax=Romanomermis culicivorax TaxID=13658 RepID=A0A915JR25_ROMCU